MGLKGNREPPLTGLEIPVDHVAVGVGDLAGIDGVEGLLGLLRPVGGLPRRGRRSGVGTGYLRAGGVGRAGGLGSFARTVGASAFGQRFTGLGGVG